MMILSEIQRIFIDTTTSPAKTYDYKSIGKNKFSCSAYFDNKFNSTGWYIQAIQGADGVEAKDMMKCIGYAQGYLGQHQIFNQNNLNLDFFWIDRQTREYPAKAKQFLIDNLAYVRERTANPENEYWKQQKIVISLFDGLVEGYKQAAPESEQLSEFDLYSYISFPDVFELIIWQDHKLSKMSGARGRCTAAYRLINDGKDVMMAHNAWLDYRVSHYAILDYYLPAKEFKSKRLIQSSLIGALSSFDSFIYTQEGMFMFETSHMNMNQTLSDLASPRSLLTWQRSLAAMLFTDSPSEWVDYFMIENSGTYNNDYYVLDINKLNETKDTVWLIEQTPLKEPIYKYDMTSKLRDQGFLSSYNVPINEDLYSLEQYELGLNNKEDKNFVMYYPLETNPRHNISYRLLPKVTNVEEMMNYISYNNYMEEEMDTGVNARNGIASRADLDSETLEGTTNYKVVKASDIGSLKLHMMNSPPHKYQEPFSFSKKSGKWNHDGLPDTFDFGWQEYDAGVYCKGMELDECVKHQNCGYCAESNECLPGNADGPQFEFKCQSGWTFDDDTSPDNKFWTSATIIGFSVGVACLVAILVAAISILAFRNRKLKVDQKPLLNE